MRGLLGLGITATVLMLLASVCCADVVVSTQARLQGAVVLDGAGVRVGQNAVALDQILYLLRVEAKPTISAAQSLRMKSGEIWPVELGRLVGRKLKVNSPVFGERDIDLAEIGQIDFVLRPALAATATGTLYRQTGEAVPGKLLSVDAGRIAIESPLGVLNLPRQGCLSYVVDAAAAPAAGVGEDELRLIDGSVFRGQAMLAEGKMQLRHRLLGTLSVPLNSIQVLQRHPAGVVYLEQPVVRPTSLLSGDGLPAEMCEAGQVQLRPQARWTVKLPDSAAGGRLRVFIEPMAASQTDVRVRCVLGEKELLAKIVPAGQAGVELFLPLPSGGELLVEADYASQVRMPSGVVLERPMVMLK